MHTLYYEMNGCQNENFTLENNAPQSWKSLLKLRTTKRFIPSSVIGLCDLEYNEWGELAASYRWSNWVWEITGWSSRLRELLIMLEESIEYTSNE